MPGAKRRLQTSPTSTSLCSWSTATVTGWSPTYNSLDLAHRLPNSTLVIYPDAGHGGVFQFHTRFVSQALEFLAR